MNETLNHEHRASRKRGLAAALGAAFFFGISAPFSKLLLGSVPPLMLAGLLYLGSFAGLTAVSAVRAASGTGQSREAPVGGRDYLYLAGSILAGGVAAPLFLLYGLTSTEASAASLLLNIEGVLTVLLATLIFREHAGPRVWAAAAVMLAAGSILVYARAEGGGLPVNAGSLLVLASSLMWALDNNLTRELSHRDPYVISRFKGLAAGSANLVLAFATGSAVPPVSSVAGSLALGSLSYGASLVLFIYALRNLGAARTSTYFGAAPFIGVAASVALLGEALSLRILAASALMLAGLWLILREYHDHEHTHAPLCHDHAHIHDEHHCHGHDGEFSEPHSHMHTHDGLTHTHAHSPDLHHFHRHR
ncbi:MAG TPA: EamA family transporter [Thermodesulfobacteriota bacterium]|nr:EamA family transporter [Thermodesulfobacteriota bacterium]